MEKNVALFNFRIPRMNENKTLIFDKMREIERERERAHAKFRETLIDTETLFLRANLGARLTRILIKNSANKIFTHKGISELNARCKFVHAQLHPRIEAD